MLKRVYQYDHSRRIAYHPTTENKIVPWPPILLLGGNSHKYVINRKQTPHFTQYSKFIPILISKIRRQVTDYNPSIPWWWSNLGRFHALSAPLDVLSAEAEACLRDLHSKSHDIIRKNLPKHKFISNQTGLHTVALRLLKYSDHIALRTDKDGGWCWACATH